MICPKCGFEQPDAVECIRCGIVIEKYRGPNEAVPFQPASTESRPLKSRPAFGWHSLLRLTLLVGMGLFAISYLLKDRLPDSDEILEDLYRNPVQTRVDLPPFQIEAGNIVYTIIPLYTYELYGLVVSNHDCGAWWDIYHHGQWKDFINVKDLCVLWGGNLKGELYKEMRFTSDSWTCTYYWPNEDVGSRFNHTCLSNNHLLSYDESITRALQDTENGDQIYLSGYLAEYTHSRGEFYRGTSTTRGDTGNGACETIYVEEYKILRRAHPFWRMVFTVSRYVILGSLLLLVIRFFHPSVKLSQP